MNHPPYLVIQQEGADFQDGLPNAPILRFGQVSDMAERPPAFFYAVAINRKLDGQVIGPVIAVLPYANWLGEDRWVIVTAA